MKEIIFINDSQLSLLNDSAEFSAHIYNYIISNREEIMRRTHLIMKLFLNNCVKVKEHSIQYSVVQFKRFDFNFERYFFVFLKF